MVNYQCTVLVLFIAFSLEKVDLLENGLVRTPPMGWMSWGYYMCADKCDENPNKCLNETLILSVVDTFYTEGYQEAGYEYIIIDDCWSEKQRDEYGRLVANKKRFPNGMKYIADYIHARGLKFGMYTNIADVTCMGYPGSRSHFSLDALTFAEWDIDYLKVDGCFVSEDYLNVAYIKLGHHLSLVGRPIIYSCSWPYYIEYIHKKKPNYKQVSKYCNLWRNYHDVVTSWGAISSIISHYAKNYDEYAPHHGPGGWNDPDMLIFGTNSLSQGQSRVQIAVYAMLSAPLLLSCDMKMITPYEKKLLLNLDLLAIAQDALGVMAKPYMMNGITLWLKPHLPMKGNSFASYSFALVNMLRNETRASFTPGNYELNCTDGYTVMDVFTGVFLRNITLQDTIEVTVPGEDVILYTLFPL